MKSVILLTNIMTPYRKFFYDKLHDEFTRKNIVFHVVLMAETESNRNWVYDEYKADYSLMLKGKTVTINGIFIHLNVGLKKLYKKLKPDVVICAGSYLYPALWETLLYSHKFGFKTYYWSESHLNEARNYGSFKVRIREALRNRVIGQFDGFWFAGKFSKEFIDCYAKKDADYIFVPNLIDNQKFNKVNFYSEQMKVDIKEKYSLPDDKKILLTVARLSPVKGIMEFLELLSETKGKDQIEYLIAGVGELKKEIEQYCNNKSLNVRLLGYKNESEILDLYSVTDIFVLSSLSDPNPLTCIEASWCSLPLLVSKHVGNYPELIEEGVNGYVIDYAKKEESVRKIDLIINSNEEFIKNASKKSHQNAFEKYEAATVVERIVPEVIEHGE